jgi:hypothetical protein
MVGSKQALALYEGLGFSIIPLKAKGKKPALHAWEEYKSRRPTKEEIASWSQQHWSDGADANVGVVCGAVSGNLVVLDFDLKSAFEVFKNEWAATRGKNVANETVVVATGRGFHVYCRVKDMPKSVKLPNVEVKAEGHYVVAPPSIHPSGKAYQFVNPAMSSIVELSSLEDIGIGSPDEVLDALLPVKGGQPGVLDGAGTDNEGELRAMAEQITPCWTQPRRHDLALAISAYLAKFGWTLDMVLRVVEMAAIDAHDEELQDRLKAAEDTFAKVRANKAVKGYTGLDEILPKKVLDRVETLAKTATISDVIRRVDAIRLAEKMAPFQKKRWIAELVVDELKRHGKFLRTAGNELFYFDGEVMALDTPQFTALLERRFGLNATESEGKYVLSNLAAVVLTEGEMVEVYRLAYWNRAKGCLYIDAGAGKVFRLNGKCHELINNGDDGVYFARDGWQLPVEPDFEHPMSPWQCLTDDLNFEVGGNVALTPEDQRLVGKLWMLSLFFPEELPTKPILCLTGDHGSGKSFCMRRLIWLLYGRGDLDSIHEQDDFWASLSANHLLALDDIERDKTPKWVGPELKRAATGQTISRRRLYTTNTVVSYTPRCFVALTSIKPPIEDSALADRLVLLRMKTWGEKKPESKMLGAIRAKRGQLWAGLLLELNAMIPRVLQEPPNSTFRMADWASLCERMVGRDKMKPILEGLTHFQDEELLGDCPLLPIIELWYCDDKWRTPAQLYQEWGELASKENMYFPFKSPRSLATHLANVRGSLSKVCGMEWQKSVGRGSRVVYRIPIKWQPAEEPAEDVEEDASVSSPEIDSVFNLSGLCSGL